MNDELRACPHCGAELSYAGDAFCPECRKSVDGDSLPVRTVSTPDVHFRFSELRSMLPFNGAGFVIIAAGFLPALGICHVLGDNRDCTKLAIGGPLAVAIDLVYRAWTPLGHWLLPNGGGKFLYLPVWILAVFWTVYGAWQFL